MRGLGKLLALAKISESAFTIQVALCSDAGRTPPIVFEASGVRRSLFLQLDDEEEQLVDLKYYQGKKVQEMIAVMNGDLKAAENIRFRYASKDIMCIEQLELVDSENGHKMNIIQDYDPYAWDVDQGNQEWESLTGRKISYWSVDCSPDDRPLTLTAPFAQSCHDSISFSLLEVDECADGSHACDINAECIDTPTSYICTCNDGFVGAGLNLPQSLTEAKLPNFLLRSNFERVTSCVPVSTTTTSTAPTSTTLTSTTLTTEVPTTTELPTTTEAGLVKCSIEGVDDNILKWLEPWPRQTGCEYPTCEAEIRIVDAWKKSRTNKNGITRTDYGWAAVVSIPPQHYDLDGFSVLIRMPKDTARGSFQVWNAKFWNFYNGPNGEFNILLHSKHWNSDRLDPYSFLIVGERLSHPEMRKALLLHIRKVLKILASVLFWSNRQRQHTCFDRSMHHKLGSEDNIRVNITFKIFDPDFL